MATPLDIAVAHQTKITNRTDAAIRKALAAWGAIDLANLSESWTNEVGPAVQSYAETAQNLNAADANGYVAQANAAYGIGATGQTVNSSAFVGIDGSGRSLGGLLVGSVVSTKEAIASGLAGDQALLAGQVYLAAMMKTALHDMSRSADLTGFTAKQYTHYVRYVHPGACSRCAALAGIDSSAHPFPRHPACQCSAYPVVSTDEVPKGLHADPRSYFDSLSKDEQDKVFTQAGAEAIRSGADVTQVVTGRRGAPGIQYGHAIGRETHANSGRQMVRTRIGTNRDGTPIYGYTTTEGTTRRGDFGRLNRNLTGGPKYTRLMPETIVTLTDNPELRVTLLRDAGYLSSNMASSDPRRIAQAARDRATATQFYRSLGIQLGG